LIVAADAPFTASVELAVLAYSASNWMWSPAAGVNVGVVVQVYAVVLVFDCAQFAGRLTLCAVATATCPLLFVPTTLAEAGTARPLILPTVVATVPAELVTSPVSAGICAAVTPVEVVINVELAGIVVPFTLVLFVRAAGN
jgi:hypothetical protein